MGYRRRVDGPHKAITKALRRIGCTVVDTSRLGSGFPDLVVGYRLNTLLVEVKSEEGDLNAAQVKFHASWTGSPVLVPRSDVEAIAMVQAAVRSPPR